MKQLPPDFINQIQTDLGSEAKQFFKSLEKISPTAIRYNPFKKMKSLIGEEIEWCNSALYLNPRPKFSIDPFFHAGIYYVQEPASMFLEQVYFQIKNTFSKEKIKEGIRVLDLCAAPGGKSTHLLSLLHSQDLLVSNELITSRNKILQYNIIKWGNNNCVITSNQAKDFQSLDEFFDIILVDAPCSGEGLFRKDHDASDEWSLKAVNGCSQRQRDILKDIIPSLKKDGFIIYSTCTYNKKENDNSIEYAIANLGCQSIQIETKNKKLVRTKYGIQFYPHKVETEGFYISILQKKSDSKNNFDGSLRRTMYENFSFKEELNAWLFDASSYKYYKHNNILYALPTLFEEDFKLIQSYLNIQFVGILCASIKSNLLIPSPELALSNFVIYDVKSELNLEQTLKYLKGESLELNNNKNGWSLVTYLGLNLGWVKILPTRINNYYPNHWRIN
jgi:16S rRNA C967 or C1407 C5-methylase (RsmB/RsmF family)/NOL1/NOP2/fmu family ribosome biogenesis protein